MKYLALAAALLVTSTVHAQARQLRLDPRLQQILEAPRAPAAQVDQRTAGDLYLDCTADVCSALYAPVDRDYQLCIAAKQSQCMVELDQILKYARTSLVEPVCSPPPVKLAVVRAAFILAIQQRPAQMGRPVLDAVFTLFNGLWPCPLAPSASPARR
jgi:hypothetical protein